MKLTKRILAGTLALSMVMPLVACGDDSSKQTVTTPHVDQVTVPVAEDTQTIEKLPEGENTLEWFGFWDINPSAGNDRDVALTLFEDQYGGKINYNQTTWETQYDDLANAILASKGPDFVIYNTLAFPQQTLKEFYQPIDSIVDFEQPLWTDVARLADTFVINGDHYVAPLSVPSTSTMFYDRTAIEENGLDDPWELYLNGEWNWNNWRDLMHEWVEGAPEDVTRYGVNGWFMPHFVNQTGKTLVINNNGRFESNLYDPDIERAQTFLYNIAKEGLIENYWYGTAKNCFDTGTTLFYAMGTWAAEGANGPDEDDDWGVVPMPADPNATEKYVTSDIFSYMWVVDSTAEKPMKAWLECNRIAQTDEQYKDINKQKWFANNPNWNEQMYEGMNCVYSSDYVPVFELANGISQNMADNIISPLYTEVANVSEDGAQNTWAQVREKYEMAAMAEINEINTALDELNG